MHKSDLAFGPLNYILLGVGIVIVIVGFILMAGSGTTEEAFNPDIFSVTRIKIAPMTCLIGFVVVIVGILVKPKRKHSGVELEEVENNQ